jgi:hypothetical protein
MWQVAGALVVRELSVAERTATALFTAEENSAEVSVSTINLLFIGNNRDCFAIKGFLSRFLD